MARQKEFDETAALQTAMHLFWEKGFEATSLQDLERATGLKRTSIYNAFGNKRALFEKVVELYRDTILTRLLDLLDSGPDVQSGLRKMLNGVIDLHFDRDTPGGCLVVLGILEGKQHDSRSLQLLEQVIQHMQKAIQARLASAKRKGELPADLDARAVSATLATTMAGLVVMAKAGQPRSQLRKSAATALRLLQ